MQMKEFLSKNEFTNALPQGDTYIELETTEMKEVALPNDDGTSRIAYEAKTKEKWFMFVNNLG